MTGRVAELWRYPVKSMLGERLEEAEIGEHGVVGDRSFALIDDETGKVCSAKRHDLWGGLFQFRSRLELPGLAHITFPDGSERLSDDPDLAEALSDTLGRRVRFASTAPEYAAIEEIWEDVKGDKPYGPVIGELDGQQLISVPASLASPGDFFDFASMHVLTTSTVAELGRREPDIQFDVRRFRPNIVVEVPGANGFVENEWSSISVGDVRLQVLIPVPRCVMTTLAQGELPRDPGVLRAAATHNMIEAGPLGEMPCVGVYASVAAGGRIRVGDEVEAGS